MIVAVTIVLMVQMAIDEIVDVIAMRNRFVSAVRTMYMRCVVSTAIMPAGTGGWVRFVYIQSVLFDDTSGCLVMQVTIVQEVDMVSMLKGGMATV